MKKKADIRKVKDLARELIDALKDLQSDSDIGKMEILDDSMNMILEISILRIEFLIKRLTKLIEKVPRDSRGRRKSYAGKSIQK